MLSSVPTREKKKPKSYRTSILVGLIFILLIALSGISSLYYFTTQSESPTVIVINETSNGTSTNQTQSVKNTTSKADKQSDKKKTTTSPQKDINKKTDDKLDDKPQKTNNYI